MPLTFGVPLGLMIALVGVVLFRANPRNRAALAILAIGLMTTFATVVLIALVMNSSM